MRTNVEVDGQPLEIDPRASDGGVEVRLGERSAEVDSCWLGPRSLSLVIDGQSHHLDIVPVSDVAYDVFVGGRRVRVAMPSRELSAWSGGKKRAAAGRLTAPMPGKVVAILVAQGDDVVEGQGLLVVEAMKMENELQASAAGRVGKVHVSVGQIVDGGAPLVDIG